MKKLLLSTLLLSFYGVAQDTPTDDSFVEHAYNTSFFKTPPIRSFFGSDGMLDEQDFENAIAKDGKRTNSVGLQDIGIPENNGIDPALQTASPIHKGNGTKVNINGLGGAFPPDPSGAAGPNNYVQAVNTSYKIYNKDGTYVGG